MNSLMSLCSVIGVGVKHGSAPEDLREDFHGFLWTTPFSPPSGLATGSLNGLNPKSKFLALR